MAIFTTIATAVLAGTALAGTFAVTALATVLSIGASIGLSYVSKALAGNPNGADTSAAEPFSIQGILQAGGDVSRSFNLGYSSTAGSLVYANTWGEISPGGIRTPNAFLTQVIALADLPGGDLVEVWINGELCTLGGVEGDLGNAVIEYQKDGSYHVWVKYYDGTQTTADPLCVNSASSVDRPYESTRVGTGVAYVVVTSTVDDTLFTGFPTFKFAVSGIPLYDPTKDSTNGGSGSHRWSDQSTWGGDGDDFPAVQAYNVLRGIYYNGAWLYGLQRMTAARLPALNWNVQIDKCRATVTGVGGAEPTYRTGGQVTVDTQTVRTIESLLTGCQGRLSEIGGFYKIHLGAPDSPSFVFTDDDILSTEEQNFAPFFGLADSINGITATYPSPAEGWNAKVAPPLFNEDFEVEDGDRRLLANPSFEFVPYDAQVQRLQKSALQEARRARRHSLSFPPAFWIIEPGDVGEWSSFRNGYEAKQFRVDGVTDRANLDVIANLTEVDPTDYDWDHAVDYTGVTTGPTVFPRPEPQGILDWFAEPYTLYDSNGISRRPAIRLSWDGDMPGVVGVQYEVRLESDGSSVTRGRTDQLAIGSIIISQSLLPETTYEARGQYLPSAPRDMLWSDWLSVTTPDIKISILEFDAALHQQVIEIQDAMNDKLAEIEQRIATLTAGNAAKNWIDKKEVRSQLFATAGNATAEIEEVRLVAVGAESAVASLSTSVSATFGPSFSEVNTVSNAVATLDGFAAAEYSVTLDVNGYASGFGLINGGAGFSTFTISADKIQFVYPSVNGGAPRPFLTTGTVNGVAAIGMTGNFFLDGVMHARAIQAGSITSVELAAGSITAGKIAAGSINTAELAVNSVSLANIIAGSVTAETYITHGAFAALSAVVVTTLTSNSVTILSGNASIEWDASVDFSTSPVGGLMTCALFVDGVSRRTWTWRSDFYAPFSHVAYVTGLSSGAHTFELKHMTNSGGSMNIGAGFMLVRDLRR